METSTLNQLIESSTLIIIATLGVIFYWKANRIRTSLAREAKLLKDCVFYRQVIDIYAHSAKEEVDFPSHSDIRATAEHALGYKPSTFSQPTQIKSRLESLAEKDKRIQDFIEKIPF